MPSESSHEGEVDARSSSNDEKEPMHPNLYKQVKKMNKCLKEINSMGYSLNHLAETWELPSLSRLACTPYYRHPRCKIIQCTHTPLLDVRPRGRNQDKPVRCCATSCINHLG